MELKMLIDDMINNKVVARFNTSLFKEFCAYLEKYYPDIRVYRDIPYSANYYYTLNYGNTKSLKYSREEVGISFLIKRGYKLIYADVYISKTRGMLRYDHDELMEFLL